MKTYLCVCLGAALLSLLFTPIVMRVARMVRIYDLPGVRKVHQRAIPRVGGIAIALAVLCMAIPAFLLHNTIGEDFRQIQSAVVTMLAMGIFVFLLGLLDDVRGLRARTKLVGQVLAAAVVCGVGIRIDSITVADWFVVDFGISSWLVTIIWIVGITNAVNLIDGLDGLAAGISAIACGVIAALAIHTGQTVMAVLMLALLGSLCGFLFFNFNPAKIFMGDCGSMFLGFILATASVMCATKSATLVGLALPLAVLGVPIFDMLFSVIRRVLERRSIFAPDRNHIHHRLLEMGLPHHLVVISMYAMTLAAGGLGMFMMVTRNAGVVVILLCVTLLLVVVFRMVGAVRLRESTETFRKNLAISRQTRQEREIFENAQLQMREADGSDSRWRALCDASGRLDFVWLALTTKTNGRAKTAVWRAPGISAVPPEAIILTVPSQKTSNGLVVRIEVAVRPNGSLESVGRRVALFGRLIEENNSEALTWAVDNLGPSRPDRAGWSPRGSHWDRSVPNKPQISFESGV